MQNAYFDCVSPVAPAALVVLVFDTGDESAVGLSVVVGVLAQAFSKMWFPMSRSYIPEIYVD